MRLAEAAVCNARARGGGTLLAAWLSQVTTGEKAAAAALAAAGVVVTVVVVVVVVMMLVLLVLLLLRVLGRRGRRRRDDADAVGWTTGFEQTETEATHHSLRGAWSRLFLIPPLDVRRMRLRHCYNYQCGVEEPAGEVRAFWTRVRLGCSSAACAISRAHGAPPLEARESLSVAEVGLE